MNRRNFVTRGAGALGLALVGTTRAARLGAQEAGSAGTSIRITLASIFVDDQAKALTFYTERLGLVKKHDVPLGGYRWLTVVSPLEPDGTELLLEPNVNPAASTYQQAIFEQGIPATSLAVGDIHHEYERLQARGVEFTSEPRVVGDATIVMFHDTCGNLMQLHQPA